MRGYFLTKEIGPLHPPERTGAALILGVYFVAEDAAKSSFAGSKLRYWRHSRPPRLHPKLKAALEWLQGGGKPERARECSG